MLSTKQPMILEQRHGIKIHYRNQYSCLPGHKTGWMLADFVKPREDCEVSGKLGALHKCLTKPLKGPVTTARG